MNCLKNIVLILYNPQSQIIFSVIKGYRGCCKGVRKTGNPAKHNSAYVKYFGYSSSSSGNNDLSTEASSDSASIPVKSMASGIMIEQGIPDEAGEKDKS